MSLIKAFILWDKSVKRIKCAWYQEILQSWDSCVGKSTTIEYRIKNCGYCLILQGDLMIATIMIQQLKVCHSVCLFVRSEFAVWPGSLKLTLKVILLIEIWGYSLKFGDKVWSWSFKLRLKLKVEVELWIWNASVMFESEIWVWVWDMTFVFDIWHSWF